MTTRERVNRIFFYVGCIIFVVLLIYKQSFACSFECEKCLKHYRICMNTVMKLYDRQEMSKAHIICEKSINKCSYKNKY